jgi:flavin-dependent dehydrogenase
MLDVIVAGAGPAGAIAALVLARAGARVVIVDRELFPRDKLCGDTLNPGAIEQLRELGLGADMPASARPLFGMRLTGPHASVAARYPAGVYGLAVRRIDLDAWLLEQAVRAGARFEGGLTVRRALVDDTAAGAVRGLVLSRRADVAETRMPAVLTIAADGRRSAVCRSVGLTGEAPRPRRWAYGVYASGVRGMTDLGEMHVRGGWYLGIAPVTDSLVNVCVVRHPEAGADRPLDVITRAIDSDAELRDRFREVQFESDVRVLGPLGCVVHAVGRPGVLAAGDASGFVDPMTGDGLRLAIQSAVLAAREAIHTLESGDFAGAASRLQRARQAAFGAKVRFNDFVRRLVDSPGAVSAADVAARLVPFALRRAVCYAGDVP